MKLDWTAFVQSLDALDSALAEQVRIEADSASTVALRTVVRAGVIQNFEVVYEQAWKAMRRRVAQDEGPETIDPLSRRELFRLAHRKGLLEEAESWLLWHEARNLTSHTYSGDTAISVASQAAALARGARWLLDRLVRDPSVR